ncbi:MAG: hypothetical protein JO106_10325, partial [Mycobacterium sp.]|nr:hypothetical protein [Mycobacterium sp.]
MIARACVDLHRIAGILFAGEFFHPDLGDSLIAGWSGRGERVAGLLLAEQLIVTNLGKVPIAINPAAPRRLSLGRFMWRRRGLAY